jgi:hypothetical protein
MKKLILVISLLLIIPSISYADKKQIKIFSRKTETGGFIMQTKCTSLSTNNPENVYILRSFMEYYDKAGLVYVTEKEPQTGEKLEISTLASFLFLNEIDKKFVFYKNYSALIERYELKDSKDFKSASLIRKRNFGSKKSDVLFTDFIKIVEGLGTISSEKDEKNFVLKLKKYSFELKDEIEDLFIQRERGGDRARNLHFPKITEFECEATKNRTY